METKIGTRFNFLTTIDQPFREKRTTKIKCKCDCGKEKVISLTSLKSGATKSCGCYNLKLRKKGHNRYKIPVSHPYYSVYARIRFYSKKNGWDYIGWEEFFNWYSPQYKKNLRVTRYDLNKPWTLDNMYLTKSTITENGKKNAAKKRKKTCQNKYGVDSYTQTPEYIEKKTNTCLKKYGLPHPQTKETQEKTKNTNLQKYGVPHCQQNPDVRLKSKQTCLDRYGVDHPSKDPIVLKRILDGHYSKYGRIKSQSNRSQEKEIEIFVNNLGFSTYGYKLKTNKEIDIYIPDKNIGIEYCGIHWHNELSRSSRGRDYHINKYRQAKIEGFDLITLYSSEWILRKEQVKNRIAAILGCGEVIGARKCHVSLIDNKLAQSFVNQYHLQIQNRLPKISIGIYDNLDLVGVMTFNKHHRNHQQMCLDRMCFSKRVIGGPSRMINFARNYISEPIRTWSDNRWTDGKVYKIMGFKLINELGPDYAYVRTKTPQEPIVSKLQNKTAKHSILSKQFAKKSYTGCPKEISERDFMIHQGFGRIWDCGKKVWELK